MTFEGEQLALFDLPEIPHATLQHSSHDADRLVTNWASRSTVKKATTKIVSELVLAKLNAGISAETITYALDTDTLLSKEKTFTSVALDKALDSVDSDKLARRILHKWLNRTTISGLSAQVSIIAVRDCLMHDISVEDIKYTLEHRTLLASHKRLSASGIVKAVASIDKDKQAGRRATQIFQKWYDKWYEGRYTQPIGQITAALKKTLLDDIKDDLLEEALDAIGRAQSPVTGPSIQYGLVQAEKTRERRKNAGANNSLQPGSEFSTVSSAKNVQDNASNQERWDVPW